jgi:hypothetical protein
LTGSLSRRELLGRVSAVALSLGVLETVSACGGESGGDGAPVSASAAESERPERAYGEGAERVWILESLGPTRSIVVFFHGWTAVSPVDWHRYWFKHLREQGSTVLFPAYQEGASGDVEALTIDPLRIGLQRGFRELRAKDLPVVAAGFSFGGTLAFVYGSFAERWGLPVPEAVYSVFPVGQIFGLGLPDRLPPSTVKVLILAGDQDEVVGTHGAEVLLKWLEDYPDELKEYRLIRSTPAVPARHEALKGLSDEATATFWTPLDELIQGARTGEGGGG